MSRPRGRPRKGDDPGTRDGLLAAAADACVEVGFDGVTLADVARRAGVSPTAVYNHFADKGELLYTAGRMAIDRLNAGLAPAGDPRTAAHEAVAAFLAPSFRSSRRLILELHQAGARHPEVAEHLAAWHREFAVLGGDPIQVKTLFLLLLGCCHVDDLDAIEGSEAQIAATAARLVDALYAGHPSPSGL